MNSTRFSIALGAAAVSASLLLLFWDARPDLFPRGTHEYVASFSLGVIAIAWLVWQSARGITARELLKTALLAAAFLFWAANQLWPYFKGATVFNDAAVGLFVLDVLLTMLQWPPGGSLDKDTSGL